MVETSPVTSAAVEPADRSWLVEVEGLRGVAFVLIVFGHAAATIAGVPHSVGTMAFFGACLAVSRFALLSFMTLSSLLIAHRIAEGRPVGTWNAVRRLVVPYAIWTVFYILLTRALQGGPGILADRLGVEVVRALLTGTGFYHLWYVVVAIQIVVVAPWLARKLFQLTMRTQIAVALAILAGNVVLLGQVSGPVVEIWAPSGALFGAYSDRIVIFWAAYVALGVVLGLNYRRAIQLLRRYRVVVLPVYAAAVVAMFVLVFRQSAAAGGDYQAVADISRVMQPWIVPFEVLSVVVWLDVGGALMRTRASRELTALSAVSFGGYLIHPFWIMVGLQFVTARNVSPSPVFLVIALTGFALAASVLTVIATWRATVPFGTALFGSAPRRGSG